MNVPEGYDLLLYMQVLWIYPARGVSAGLMYLIVSYARINFNENRGLAYAQNTSVNVTILGVMPLLQQWIPEVLLVVVDKRHLRLEVLLALNIPEFLDVPSSLLGLTSITSFHDLHTTAKPTKSSLARYECRVLFVEQLSHKCSTRVGVFVRVAWLQRIAEGLIIIPFQRPVAYSCT